MVTLRCYRFDPNDAARASLKTTVLYYADYVYTGEITIGNVAYRTVLVNDLCDGDFRGTVSPNGRSGVRLLADLNKDGKPEIIVGYVEAPGEVFFNDGTGKKFTRVRFGDTKGATYGLAAADLNGDGYPDIAAARSDAPSMVYFSRPPK